MSMISGQQQSHSYRFVFHGQIWPYFVICLVNVILSIITCGIFIPWAWVRSRRYLCENMEVNGTRFGYHGRGITILLSWVLIFVVLVILGLALAIFYPGSEGGEMLLFLILLPVMITKGLSYHAMMTSFGKTRFGFQCHPLRAWWVMLGMPVLMLILLLVIITMYESSLDIFYGTGNIIISVILITLLVLFSVCVISGIVYSHWLEIIGKGAALGKNKFDIHISTKRCVVIFLWATAISLPFVLIFIIFLLSAFSQMITGCMFGLCTESTALLMALQHLSAVAGGYFFFMIGLVLSAAYAWAALRNHALNNLVLGDGIQFRSTLTFSGLAPRLLGLTFLPLFTLGLTYPWLKINLMRYIAANTAAIGELDSLNMEPDAAPQPKVTEKLCGGFFPMLPFL
ncbi:YjgN family protein [Klebsiella sp. MISC125]|uniref:YjgN family protein n=1 Tax=Klebsiella sp. MISC125 TaxID=2755386 RepID=UPI003DA85C76